MLKNWAGSLVVLLLAERAR